MHFQQILFFFLSFPFHVPPLALCFLVTVLVVMVVVVIVVVVVVVIVVIAVVVVVVVFMVVFVVAVVRSSLRFFRGTEVFVMQKSPGVIISIKCTEPRS